MKGEGRWRLRVGGEAADRAIGAAEEPRKLRKAWGRVGEEAERTSTDDHISTLGIISTNR
jgi:hypothetical protein